MCRMKILLNQPANEALTRVYEKFKSASEGIGKLNGSFVGRLLESLDRNMTADQISLMANELVSPAFERKMVRERLDSLALSLSLKDLTKLEKRIQKFDPSSKPG